MAILPLQLPVLNLFLRRKCSISLLKTFSFLSIRILWSQQSFLRTGQEMQKTKSTLCQNKKIELKKVLFQRSCFHYHIKKLTLGRLAFMQHSFGAKHLTRKITESSNQSGIVPCAIMLHTFSQNEKRNILFFSRSTKKMKQKFS